MREFFFLWAPLQLPTLWLSLGKSNVVSAVNIICILLSCILLKKHWTNIFFHNSKEMKKCCCHWAVVEPLLNPSCLWFYMESCTGWIKNSLLIIVTYKSPLLTQKHPYCNCLHFSCQVLIVQGKRQHFRQNDWWLPSLCMLKLCGLSTHQ